MAKTHNDLIIETGKVLLESIQVGAGKVNATHLDGLANAYATVVAAMPQEDPEGIGEVMTG